MSFIKHSSFFFLLALVLTILDYFYLGRPHLGIDDANIFLNYAHHFAKGEGFVFNTGGERVEGFTSMLWVLICSAFYKLSSRPEPLLALFLLIITSITITLVYREIRKDIELYGNSFFRKYFRWIYSAYIVCIGPSFIAWSVLSLMENAVWNLLFITIIILLLQTYSTGTLSMAKKIILVILGPLLILCRPEGLAWGLFFTLTLLWIMKKNNRNLLLPLLFFATSACTVALLTYFRLHYFGYPLPNTYYSKVSSDRIYNAMEGFKYATGFITGYNPLVTFLAGGTLLFLLYSCTRKTPGRIVLVSIITGLGILLPFTTGGDHFGGFRFYQDLLLLVIWGLPAILWLYRESKSQYAGNALVYLGLVPFLFCALVGVNTLYGLRNGTNTQLNFEFSLASEGRDMAKDLNHFWASGPKPSIGIIAVGGFGLIYGGNTIDLMGLNNTLMGHSPGKRIGIKNHAAFNKDIFYQLQSDLILPKIVADKKTAISQYADFLNPFNFDNRAMKNIFNDDRFRQEYTCVMVTKRTDEKNIFFFTNNRFLPALVTDSSLTVTRISL